MNKNNLRSSNFLIIIRFSLAFFLMVSSAAILYSTARNYESARRLSDQSLENTALGLASAAEFALRHEGNSTAEDITDIFSDRVVAYALIADEKGNILFHTNPRRTGNILSPAERGSLGVSQKASGRRIILGTGIPAYEFDYPLHLADGTIQWLRLILHTSPADRILSDARRMWWVGLSVMLLLWIVGILFERVLTRSLKLRAEIERRQQLVTIGQMTSLLAHEIRNALASIKGYAQLVDEKLDSGDPKKSVMAFVLQGTKRIEFLVQELLQFSRDETFRIEKVSLVPLLQDSVEAAISGWRGSWKMNEASYAIVNADGEKLRRVFINGIRNAVEAMGSEGSLLVSVHQAGKWIKVEIEDSGPGIAEAQKSLLFTPFHTTKTDGTGLGLAYSKKVIEGMKGKIMLDNRQGARGAVLTVFIPKAG